MNGLPFPDGAWDQTCVARLGVAHLTRLAFQGSDLYPLWIDMMDRVTDDAVGAGLGMDLSVIAQLRGDKPTGLAIQRDSLQAAPGFQHQAGSRAPRPLRVLALATASDMGANTPDRIPGRRSRTSPWRRSIWAPACPCPPQIPAHDVAIVVAPASEDGEHALAMIEQLAGSWPAPVLNARHRSAGWNATACTAISPASRAWYIPPTLRLTRERR